MRAVGRGGAVAAAALVLAPLWAGGADAAGPVIERVTVTSAERETHEPLDGWQQVSVSGDGQVVAFVSEAPDVVPGDANRDRDVFVRDRRAGTTVRASRAGDGSDWAAASIDPHVSDDGRHVVFSVDDHNPDQVLPGQVRPRSGAYAFDARTRVTRRLPLPPYESVFDVSADGRHVFTTDQFVLRRRDLVDGSVDVVNPTYDGTRPQHDSWPVDTSPDGRFVLFGSCNDRLVRGDGGAHHDYCGDASPDLLLRDVLAGRTRRVGVRPDGTRFSAGSMSGAVSGDGRTVVFAADPTRGSDDFYGLLWLHDVASGQTRRAPAGPARDARTAVQGLDGAARTVLFESYDSDLVPGDTNGFWDVFALDLRSGAVRRVNVSATGRQANGQTEGAQLSSDGSTAVFTSTADDLVPGDRNATQDLFARGLR